MVEEALAEAAASAEADQAVDLAADPVGLAVLTEALAARTDLEVPDPQDPRISVLALAQDGGAAGTEALITEAAVVALADCSVSFWCRLSSLLCCSLLSAIAFPCFLAETARE